MTRWGGHLLCHLTVVNHARALVTHVSLPLHLCIEGYPDLGNMWNTTGMLRCGNCTDPFSPKRTFYPSDPCRVDPGRLSSRPAFSSITLRTIFLYKWPLNFRFSPFRQSQTALLFICVWLQTTAATLLCLHHTKPLSICSGWLFVHPWG